MKRQTFGLGRVNAAIVELVDRGYFSSPAGVVYGPDHRRVKTRMKTTKSYKYPYEVFSRLDVTVYVHRFIAYELFGKKAFRKDLVVRHLDGSSLNNSHENLKMGTHSQNMFDKDPEARKVLATIASRRANPRTKKEREKIYELLCRGISYKQINKRLGVAKGTLSYMKNHSEEYKEYVKSKTKRAEQAIRKD